MSKERSSRILHGFMSACLAAAVAAFIILAIPDHLGRAGIGKGSATKKNLPSAKNLSSVIDLEKEKPAAEVKIESPSGQVAYFKPEQSPIPPGQDAQTQGSALGDLDGSPDIAGGGGAAIDDGGFGNLASSQSEPTEDFQGIPDNFIPIAEDTPKGSSITLVTYPRSSLAIHEPPAHVLRRSKKEYSWIFTPPELEKEVAFWKAIYSQYDKNQVVLHHPLYLEIIYDVVDLGYIDGDVRLSELEKEHKKEKLIEEKRERIVSILDMLAQNQRLSSSLNDEEWRIKKLFDNIADPKKFQRAAEEFGVRAQLGQRDKFIAGLKHSGRYLGEIEKIYEENGMPRELTRLIFVESMFNLKAKSSVGASGIWQFMPQTGKLYLRINKIVDERNDPIAATHASIKLLRHNYNELGTWPLAINAYNAGRGRLKQAVQTLGTKDIAKIVKNFKHRAYGFASRNFFPEYLAALEVAENPEKYFGPISYDDPLRFEMVRTAYHMSLPSVANASGIPLEELLELNPGFSPKVSSGDQLIPIGYPVKVPEGKGSIFIAAAARAPKSQRGSIRHVVAPNETLNSIGWMYGVDPTRIRQANANIRRNPSRGQIVVIPFD
ncbi:MAG TPA: transglycosylase SLT domain-containing protein [bacterium]|nr:transglycosylase SLT domain-containing protein [bacterium]